MQPEQSTHMISFIIPHKGRFEMLRQTLRSIVSQTYAKDKIEIIVVSQTPEIDKQVLLENTNTPIRVLIRPETETISQLRNHGVQHSTGEYLAFLDADIVISPNWVASMLANLESGKDRVIVSAMQICDAAAPPLEQIRTRLSNAELDTDVRFLPGRNLFLTRQTFEKIGGFPEHLITCEDYYFTDKAANLGKLYYTSDANYVHLGEDKVFSEFFKKEIWRGQSNLQSIRGRRVPLRELPSFFIPPVISLSCLLIPLCLIFQYDLAALFFLVLCAGPLLLYSARLHKLCDKTISFWLIIRFYSTYFLARTIGTLAGLFKSIGANHN